MNTAKDILFSIVIPTYNRESFIRATLETVFSQTYTNYEVIIVDNCSTDNTEKVIEPFVKAGRVRFIKHDRNYERAKSRNTGMENATGDFLTFLDSDDFMYPNCLADAADFIAENPKIKCFHNLYETVNDAREVVYKNQFPEIGNRLKTISSGNFMSCIGDFIDREIYLKYRFDTSSDLTGGEDWDFWLQVLADHDVGRINKVNNGVLQHENRSVQTQTLASIERCFYYLVNKYKTDPYLSKVYAPYIKNIESSFYVYLAILGNSAGFFGKSKRYLREARKLVPDIVFERRFLKVYLRALLRKQISR